MRIEAWRIDAFGPLSSWTESGLSAHNLLVVLGDNETGKSALFEFLATALFGFAPANAQGHPYRPWDDSFPEGTVDVILHDGREAHVARRLSSSAQGRLTIDGVEEDRGNRPVPWVGLLNRAVFQNVHALTQDEALGLDKSAWQAVQDRVLGGSSFDFLRPSREVVEELESRRTHFWRQDRRGKPLDREITAHIRELRSDLDPARERRTRIEGIEARLDRIGTELSEQEEELKRTELVLERDRNLALLFRRAKRNDQIERAAAELVPVDDLPHDVSSQRKETISRVSELDVEIAGLKGKLKKLDSVQDIDKSTAQVLGVRETIDGINRNAERSREDAKRIQRMDRHLQEMAGTLNELAERTLTADSMNDDVRDAVMHLSLAELRGRHREWSEKDRQVRFPSEELKSAKADLVRLEKELEPGESEPELRELDERLEGVRELQNRTTSRRAGAVRLPTVLFWALSAVAFGGAIILVAGLVLGGSTGTALAIAGGVLAIGLGTALIVARMVQGSTDAGAADIAAWLRRLGLTEDADLDAELEQTQKARDRALRREPLRDEFERAEERELEAKEAAVTSESSAAAAHDALSKLLSTLPLAPVHLDSPNDSLVRDLEGMRRVIGEEKDIHDDRTEVAEQLEAWTSDVEIVRQKLADDLPADSFDLVATARRQLEAALDVQRAADAANEEIPELQSQLDEKLDELAASNADLQELDTRLAELDPEGSDALRGLELVESARELRIEVARARQDLDREFPNWADRVREAEHLLEGGETIELSDEQRVAIRIERDQAHKTGQELADERGSLGTERDALMNKLGPAHIAGEIEAEEESLAFVRREHDRLAVLEKLIRLAESEFRGRYQSPLVTAASRHIERFTSGRYDMLVLDESDPSKVNLQVRRSGAEFSESVAKPISRGTIQQIYFALRLALVDQVEGDEPLPLFLDEMFVNWDPGRTAKGLAVLAAMPDDRQGFLFTADPFWAERARDHVGARIVQTPQLAAESD